MDLETKGWVKGVMFVLIIEAIVIGAYYFVNHVEISLK